MPLSFEFVLVGVFFFLLKKIFIYLNLLKKNYEKRIILKSHCSGLLLGQVIILFQNVPSFERRIFMLNNISSIYTILFFGSSLLQSNMWSLLYKALAERARTQTWDPHNWNQDLIHWDKSMQIGLLSASATSTKSPLRAL